MMEERCFTRNTACKDKMMNDCIVDLIRGADVGSMKEREVKSKCFQTRFKNTFIRDVK